VRLSDAARRLEMTEDAREKLENAISLVRNGSWRLLSVLESLGLSSSE